MRPVDTPVSPLVAPASSTYVYEPYGVFLILGAFNYPLNLVVILDVIANLVLA